MSAIDGNGDESDDLSIFEEDVDEDMVAANNIGKRSVGGGALGEGGKKRVRKE